MSGEGSKYTTSLEHRQIRGNQRWQTLARYVTSSSMFSPQRMFDVMAYFDGIFCPMARNPLIKSWVQIRIPDKHCKQFCQVCVTYLERIIYKCILIPQPFYIQPAIFPQLTWGGHFTGGSLTPPISARMNHWFRVARSRKRYRKLDATKLYPTEPFSSSHHAMFKPAACDVTM